MGGEIGFVYDDGGREATGRKGSANDCACRAIAIASGRPYTEVYDRLRRFTGHVRHSKRKPSPENGINTEKRWFGDYMDELGFMWVGSTEIPMKGRAVVEVPGHAFAVIDGVVHDTHKNALDRTPVGYWIKFWTR